jgi:hypothetical protein
LPWTLMAIDHYAESIRVRHKHILHLILVLLLSAIVLALYFPSCRRWSIAASAPNGSHFTVMWLHHPKCVARMCYGCQLCRPWSITVRASAWATSTFCRACRGC